MANKRIISAAMWEDEFFTGLSIFDRLLWIGIITGVADDQGRLQDNAALIRSKVFPLDDIKISDVESGLCRFGEAHKIDRYIVDGKKIIQVVNWWKHQAPNWAGRSLFPAPNGWVDRERYHGKENKIVSVNWDKTGGYIPSLYSQLYSPNDSNEVKGEVKGEVNGEDDIKGEGEEDAAFSFVRSVLVGATGIPPDGPASIKAIDDIIAMGATEDDIRAGIGWVLSQGKTIKYYSSIVGPTRTAMQKRIQSNGNGRHSAPPKYTETF